MPMLLGTMIGFSLQLERPGRAAARIAARLAHAARVPDGQRRRVSTTHAAVATAVGATVLTDTLSLVVLAAVSGSQLDRRLDARRSGRRSPSGSACCCIFTLVVLPRLARLAFRHLGTDRIVRYLLAIAVVPGRGDAGRRASGIEGIVGAFFAGLGLNRLVPNEGPLMDRIDFFGAAVFVPIFLVSVGMLLDPSVMFEGETLKLAGLFVVAAVGGKAIAAASPEPRSALGRARRR